MKGIMGIGQAVALLGTTVKTLRRWERNDQLALGERTGSARDSAHITTAT